MFSFSYDYKKYIKINIMLNALMERNVDNIEVVVDFFRSHFGIWCTANKPADAYKIVNNISFYVKVIESIKKVDDDINASTKDKFDNYHLTKIDCDFPALVESLNF